MTTPAEIAELLGFGSAFRVLRDSVTDTGNPPPEMLLKIPEDFRRDVLGVGGTTAEELRAGLTRLRALVDEAPLEESLRLQMAFNFDLAYGQRAWTARVDKFARENHVAVTQTRKKVDSDLLNLLIRTRSAAEKRPEVPTPAELVGQGSTVEPFFDQDYVRNTKEFLDQWCTAATVDMFGFGHNRMLISYSYELQEVLRRGGRIRVLLQDPDGEAIIQANFRSSTPKAAEKDARDQQRVGLATLASLRRQVKGGSLEVRSYDIMPPFTAYFFDADSESDAAAFLWFWSWRQASSWRPGFVVRRAHDQLWFDRFYNQFTALWSDDEVTTPIPLDSP
ncbi:MAG: hypothetical protein JWQ45_2117 [Blastococcus sp.]|nr:hypothetical protein [Blastococcus sp.]